MFTVISVLEKDRISIFDYTVPEPISELPEIEPDISTQLRSPHPLFMDTTQLHKFHHDACVEIEAYDRLINVLESRLLEAKAIRGKLQKQSSQISSLLSPISRLPTETLREISAFATADHTANMLGSCSKWGSRTVDVSAVCFRWRVIALGTPELWTWFSVNLNPRAREPLELFLSRSKKSPLFFVITQTKTEMPMERGEELLRFLVDQASRWSCVYYHFTHNHPAWTVINEIKELPALQNVVCYARGYDVPVVLSEQLQGCPKLDTLVVRHDAYYYISVPSLPLDYISHINFQTLYPGELENTLGVLKACGNRMKTITYSPVSNHENYNLVYATPGYKTFAGHLEPVICKDVWQLSIGFCSSDGTYPLISEVFRRLSLPSLEDLCLAGAFEFDGAFTRSGQPVDLMI
ncbi:hypothetical protein AAF712_009225 [Marasmius tenuissimus]|uniref:F-box domain-containing protein n=1 Tax=Marasmius tenuissimus TaxID=585030 RepID=A0ABR2ZS03_9AGAR